MAKTSNDRGTRFEYRVVYLARKVGFEAWRIDLSGAGRLKGDVVVDGDLYECKFRENGFATLYSCLKNAEEKDCIGLIVGALRKDPLVVMPLKRYLEEKRGRD